MHACICAVWQLAVGRLGGRLGALIQTWSLLVRVSGCLCSDAVCDFPLKEMLCFHQARGAEATILVTKVRSPWQVGGRVMPVSASVARQGLQKKGRLLQVFVSCTTPVVRAGSCAHRLPSAYLHESRKSIRQIITYMSHASPLDRSLPVWVTQAH